MTKKKEESKPYGWISDSLSLYHGECLEVMDYLISLDVKVDAIICDPPYGTTTCSWDSIIPFNKHIMVKKGKKETPVYEDEWIMNECETTYKSIHECREEFNMICREGLWDKLNKLIKPNKAIVLFGSEPFSSALRMSNIKNYKYDWIWNKNRVSNPAHAKRQPLKHSENISVFNNHNYFPQGLKPCTKKLGGNKSSCKGVAVANKKADYKQEGTNYPRHILNIKADNYGKNCFHPTQKPVKLMEYLIKTYTNENEIVLDFTCGSGSTGVASKKLNRNFIGIDNGFCEKEGKYKNWKWVDVTRDRIEKEIPSTSSLLLSGNINSDSNREENKKKSLKEMMNGIK